MKEIYAYKDEYNNDCQFLRGKYYKYISDLITDFFEEPLPDNDFHTHFLNVLNTLEDYDDIYYITSEMPFYWAICIIENRRTHNHLIKNKTNEDYKKWHTKYRTANDFVTFIIEEINEKTYIFNDNEGGKSLFLRGKYYEFVCSLVTDFLGKPLENNLINTTLIGKLNTLPASGQYKNISQFIDTPPYCWAMSIIENKETTNVFNPEQLKVYTKFLEEFNKKNRINSFVIPQHS
ncbi:uncharacterized protein CHSO_3441 [Chryseobacterium sp. StRB126]|uniref:hypothetical protein n=1 Tax=Chryseobacterium sp. StRB126 TaxID=878220 RepID=UPI0004E98811|nr:hypothetical protein [Chryseobacterium sp. StRB126]BAP32478.1 uncharacterized protein CHSO_3441 [Chryseobacterium sp. StRB126]